MAKKALKRRAWTSVQVRELKTLARKKIPAARIAKTLKRSEGATRQKSIQHWALAGFPPIIAQDNFRALHPSYAANASPATHCARGFSNPPLDAGKVSFTTHQ
jgi:hypothetical protein